MLHFKTSKTCTHTHRCLIPHLPPRRGPSLHMMVLYKPDLVGYLQGSVCQRVGGTGGVIFRRRRDECDPKHWESGVKERAKGVTGIQMKNKETEEGKQGEAALHKQ